MGSIIISVLLFISHEESKPEGLTSLTTHNNQVLSTPSNPTEEMHACSQSFPGLKVTYYNAVEIHIFFNTPPCIRHGYLTFDSGRCSHLAVPCELLEAMNSGGKVQLQGVKVLPCIGTV